MAHLKEMSSAETRLLHDLGEAWTSYGPALRDKFELDGGMTWKTVHGHEYLCRYRPDSETGKKKFTSLGRRSPETEATYNAFIKRREVARQTVLTSRDDIALSGRLAKAHGLARLPAKSADVLRAFWHRSIDDQLTLFGGSALFAYEIDAEILAPTNLTHDDRLQFMFDGSSDFLMIDDILDAYEAAAGGKARVTQKKNRTIVEADDAVPIELLSSAYATDRVEDDDQIEVLREAFKLPAVRGLTVARDAQPAELKTFDPRAYAMMAYVLGKDDEIWAERAQFAGALVRERWPEQFAPQQEAAFPDVCLDPDEQRPRIYGP